MLKITYYHTLYKKDVTDIVRDDIKFITDLEGHSFVTYSSFGQGHLIGCNYIRSIISDDENKNA